MTTIDPMALTCPVPIPEGSRVILGHGSGGQLSGALMRDVIAPCLAAASPGGPLNDAAVVDLGGTRVAFTTDSFVVSPLVFPGGDIAELAVNGTVNDLAMMGAQPAALSLAFVIEEGLPLEQLGALTASAARAAAAAGTQDRHRRHQGGQPGRRGQDLHQHHRHRRRAARRAARRRPGPAG